MATNLIPNAAAAFDKFERLANQTIDDFEAYARAMPSLRADVDRKIAAIRRETASLRRRLVDISLAARASLKEDQ